ncbi:hypothetical protein [Arthrobacter sp. ISL-95]|nr:hypothetical protein [Arthrobacter sp. ISL-95]
MSQRTAAETDVNVLAAEEVGAFKVRFHVLPVAPTLPAAVAVVL